MRRRRTDPVSVVEAAYSLEADDEQWLASVAELMRPVIDRGDGVLAYYYDTSQPGTNWLERLVALDPSARFRRVISNTKERLFTETPAAFLNLMHTSAPLFSNSVLATRAFGLSAGEVEAFRGAFRPFGFEDTVALRTSDGTGRGIVMNAVWREPARFDARTLGLWNRVAAHLAAGLRLRRGANEAAALADPEAILRPDGRVEDATGQAKPRAARDLLRDAVLRQERARGRARREDPEAALDLWRGLEYGRWSLVDHFERGGRRYLVARRNAVDFADPRGLAPRERQVAALAALGHANKLIAYELGLAASTVANHLGAALRKLGLRSRVELIRSRG